MKAKCPKCKLKLRLTRHHVYPVRHYGRKDNKEILYICRECHDDLEKNIPFQKQAREFYTQVIDTFLGR